MAFSTMQELKTWQERRLHDELQTAAALVKDQVQCGDTHLARLACGTGHLVPIWQP
jgi:hypothetical protein